MEPTFLVLGLAANGPHPTHIDGSMLLAGIDPTTHLPRLVELGDNGTLGASSLNELTDVNITSPEDGHYLAYDSASGKWVDSAGLPGSGTVTSVGVVVPNILNVSGSPVTTSGVITIGLATQVANTIFGGPASGIDAIPTFRALAALDIPTTLRATTLPGLTLQSTTSPITLNASVGSSGQVLTSAGAGATPTWVTATYVPGSGTNAQFLRGDNAWSNSLNGALTLGSTATPIGTLSIPIAPTNSTNFGLINIGSGPFDGSGGGFNSGNSNSTILAVNAASGYSGRLVDLQIAGVALARIGMTTIASGALSVLNTVDFPGPTVTITGVTGISNAAGFNYLHIGQPTYSGTVTVTNAATVVIDGAPVASGTTITNAYAMWIKAGTSRFDGPLVLSGATGNVTASGTGANTFSGQILGPSGSASSPPFSSSSLPNYGSFFTTNFIQWSVAGVVKGALTVNGTFELISTGGFGWAASTDPTASVDTYLGRLSARSIKLGDVPSATPGAYTLVIGEASRPGTDTNIAGANGTIQSGLGTGTGTGSSLIFQTPTVTGSGTGVQSYATRLTLDSGLAQIIPTTVFGPTNGYVRTTSAIGISIASDFWVGWTTAAGNSGAALDLTLGKLGAANLRIGTNPSATPIANILTIGEASRPGTDTNIAGANGTIQSGLGTGTGTGSSLIFQTPTVTGSGSGVQSYTTRLTLNASGLTIPSSSSITNGGIALQFQSTAWTLASNIGSWNGDTSLTISGLFGLTNGSVTGAAQAYLASLGTANIRQGAAPSATPVAQILTIGEASRPGTDSNVGGANGTIQSGLGTGTGTPSSLIFQTPTVAGLGTGVQTQATRLTLNATAITATVPYAAPSGSAGAAAIQLGTPGVGIYNSGNGVAIAASSTLVGLFSSTGVFSIYSTLGLSNGNPASIDVTLARLAAASLQLGAAASATPIANTLTIGESSRSGTDTNTAGASGTLRPGTGTGTATPAPLIFTAPITVASGTGAQTQTEGLRVQGVGTAIGLGFYGHAAAARASAYTPTNVSTDRSYDANVSSIDELADVLGTLIADLQSYGLLG